MNNAILDALHDHEVWLKYLNKIACKGLVDNWDYYRGFIESKSYIPYLQKIEEGVLFSDPSKITIGKLNTEKKRIVYQFPIDEQIVLKVLADLLMDYIDGRLCGNTYAFRKGHSAGVLFRSLASSVGDTKMYACKTDFSDYFNSIDVDILLEILKEWLDDEPAIYGFIEGILRNDKVLVNGVLTTETKKGVMAGVPLAGILANIYVSELDWYFYDHNILYARYSDDIIFFADSREKIDICRQYILDFAQSHKLAMNVKKEELFVPGEAWNYVGFRYFKGEISISDASLRKIKMKIRRLRRKALSVKGKNRLSDEDAVHLFIEWVSRKIKGGFNDNFSWTRWFFPVITTGRNLIEIDRYIEDSIRYIYHEKHNKGRFRLRYETIRSLGYKPLTRMYYEWLEKNNVEEKSME